jgi:tetratricopeptide (TPR) repeat protein
VAVKSQTVLVVLLAAGYVAVLSCGCASHRRKEAEAHYNQGLAHANRREWDAAIRDYTKAIELDPESTLAYRGRGGAHARKGDYDAAIKDLGKAFTLDPRYEDVGGRGLAYGQKGDRQHALIGQGRALRNAGVWDVAIDCFTKAIEVGPASPDVFHDRAIAHSHRYDYEKAWADVKECQRLGGEVDPKFLAELRKASGREE